MSILSFDKPTKIEANHEDLGGFDGGPPGGYIPNMSPEDKRRFKAKIVNGAVPRVEVRVSLNSEVLIKIKDVILAEPTDWKDPIHDLIRDHGGKNIKISMNGPMIATFEEWETFKAAVDEAIALIPGRKK